MIDHSHLFFSLQWQCEELNVAQKEIRVVEVTEIKNRDGAKQVSFPFYLQRSLSLHKDY